MYDLYPFQQEVVDLTRSGHNVLVVHDCGLGKTITAIEVIKAHKGLRRPALVLALKPSFDQWVEEIQAQDPGASVQIIGRGDSPNQGVDYVITNLETLLYPPSLEVLEKTFWSVIVTDEAHRIKNRKAKRSAYVKRLVGHRRLALTGTPMEKSPADMWSILHWLRPNKYTSYWSFVRAFVQTDRNWLGKIEFIGPKNLDRLQEIIKHDVHRYTKEKAAPWLPKVKEYEVHVPMSPGQASLYRKVADSKDIVVEAGNWRLIIPNAMAHIVRLQQLSSHPALLDMRGIPSGKQEWIKNYIEDNPDANILVFSRFRGMVMELARAYNAPCIVGGSDEKVPKGCRLAFGTIGSMGTALSMGWMDVAIFWDVDRSATNMSQAKDRIHRLDSTTPKDVIYLSSTGTVDSLILESVQKKWSDANLVYEFLTRRQYGYDTPPESLLESTES